MFSPIGFRWDKENKITGYEMDLVRKDKVVEL
jgi:hypothetical protein